MAPFTWDERAVHKASGGLLFGRDAEALARPAARLEFVHEVVQFLHDRLQLLEASLAFLAQRLEGRERRSDIADGIAGRGRQRLRVALMTVGRMALVDHGLHLVDEPLDLFGVLDSALGDEIANAVGRAGSVVAVWM